MAVLGISSVGSHLAELHYAQELTVGPGGIWDAQRVPGIFFKLFRPSEEAKSRQLDRVRASLELHLGTIGDGADKVMRFIRQKASKIPFSEDQRQGIRLYFAKINHWQTHVGSLFQGAGPLEKLTRIYTRFPGVENPEESAKVTLAGVERIRNTHAFLTVEHTLNYDVIPEPSLYISLVACACGREFSERTMQGFASRFRDMQHQLCMEDLWNYFHLLLNDGSRDESEILKCISHLASALERYGIRIYSLRDRQYAAWAQQLHNGELTQANVGGTELVVSGNVDFNGGSNGRRVFSLSSHPHAMLVISPLNCFANAQMAAQILEPTCVPMQRILACDQRGLLVERLDNTVAAQAWDHVGINRARLGEFCAWVRRMTAGNFLPHTLDPNKFMYSFDGEIRALEPMRQAPFNLVALEAFLWTCCEQNSATYRAFFEGCNLDEHPDRQLFQSVFQQSLTVVEVDYSIDTLLRHDQRETYIVQMRILQAEAVRVRDNLFAHFNTAISMDRITDVMREVYFEWHLICRLPSSFGEEVKLRLRA